MNGGHFCIDFYRSVFGQDFDAYFKFAITRNPWDRVVSAFHFLKGGGLFAGDKEWAERHLAGIETFSDFVNGWLSRRNIYKGIHFVPQHEFICDGTGRLAVDYVGKFERMAESFEEICGRLGLEGKELPHTNRSQRGEDYRSYYGNHEREIVAELYRKDIELFGYEF